MTAYFLCRGKFHFLRETGRCSKPFAAEAQEEEEEEEGKEEEEEEEVEEEEASGVAANHLRRILQWTLH